MFTLTLVNTCILHHFAVGGPTNSQDILQMLQRFVNKLRDKILKSAGGYCFVQNLQSWLDGASNKFVDEILMIMDKADMLKGLELIFKLYVLMMSRTRFKVNAHSIVA